MISFLSGGNNTEIPEVVQVNIGNTQDTSGLIFFNQSTAYDGRNVTVTLSELIQGSWNIKIRYAWDNSMMYFSNHPTCWQYDYSNVCLQPYYSLPNAEQRETYQVCNNSAHVQL